VDPACLAPVDEPPLAWRRLVAILGYGAWWHVIGALYADAFR
jgi:hypothetical protein